MMALHHMPQISLRDLFKPPTGSNAPLRFSLPAFLGLAATLSLFGAMLGWNANRLGHGIMPSRLTHGALFGYEELSLAGSLVGAGLVTALLISAWVRLVQPRRRLLAAYTVIWLASVMLTFTLITAGNERLIPLCAAFGPSIVIALAAIIVLPGAYAAEIKRPPFVMPNPLRQLRPTTGLGRTMLTPLSLPSSIRTWIDKRQILN